MAHGMAVTRMLVTVGATMFATLTVAVRVVPAIGTVRRSTLSGGVRG